MAEYAKPLRALPVDEIDTEAVLGVLQPLWQARPETASRAAGQDRSGFGCGARQGIHLEERSEPGPVARPPRQALAEAPEANARPFAFKIDFFPARAKDFA